ncbi:hypothetical protein [Flavobacterium defluvii]|uniref:Uncharacterized protein n=1 Tax=Flavobacterium defluvii TaxID=370979 RepID=A0A1M5E600_9FLAO|nr:hypothetical protein [Flavobacterium defluvii]SHF74669.1 hypothetical protein SAMN05443663_10139 [Flavobacterium defluvii]
MKNKIILIPIAIFAIGIFQRCTNNSTKSQKVISQELLYDSIKKQSKSFDIDLTTIVEFKDTDSTSSNFNNLFLVIEKDTFPLIPDLKNKEFIKERNTLKIKFATVAKFTSKTYENDSLSEKILKSIIIIDKSKIIEKDKHFVVKSLILGYPVRENGIKFE